MIDLSEIYRTETNKGQQERILEFKCEYCPQEYTLEIFNIAVFLYGLIFLVGKRSGFVGITCPQCMKTILMEGKRDLADFTKGQISKLDIPPNSELSFSLKYYSSVNRVPELIPELKNFDIRYFRFVLNDNLEEINNDLGLRVENSSLNDHHFCSYDHNNGSPLRSELTVLWFRGSQINDLLKIENDDLLQLKVFPRYMPSCTFYENVEKYCWDNHLAYEETFYVPPYADITREKLKELWIFNEMEVKNILGNYYKILGPFLEGLKNIQHFNKDDIQNLLNTIQYIEKPFLKDLHSSRKLTEEEIDEIISEDYPTSTIWEVPKDACQTEKDYRAKYNFSYSYEKDRYFGKYYDFLNILAFRPFAQELWVWLFSDDLKRL